MEKILLPSKSSNDPGVTFFAEEGADNVFFYYNNECYQVSWVELQKMFGTEDKDEIIALLLFS